MEDGVDVTLEATLRGDVECEADETEVDAVCRGFMAGHQVDKGVAHHLAIGEGLSSWVGGQVGAFDHGGHQVRLIRKCAAYVVRLRFSSYRASQIYSCPIQ